MRAMVSRRSRRFLGLAALLFAACAEPEAPTPTLPRVDVEEMNVSFDFHEPLTLRASQDEAILSGEHTAIQVQTLPYAESVAAATDGEAQEWALPRAVAQAVFDQRSCAPLRTEKTFLPVDTTAPIRCDLVLDPAGRAVVWMVGLGRPYQDVTFLQSSVLVLEAETYHVFSYITPFPEADATVQWLAETFPERHPNMSSLMWPNKSFLLHMDEVRTTLSKHVDPPSAEVLEAMEALRKVAFSVGPSRAKQDL